MINCDFSNIKLKIFSLGIGSRKGLHHSFLGTNSRYVFGDLFEFHRIKFDLDLIWVSKGLEIISVGVGNQAT